MRKVAAGIAVRLGIGIALAVSTAGCSQVQDVLAEPFLGSVEECSPNIEAGLCRRIGETAIRAVPGPAISAESLSVAQWDSCANEQLVGFAPGAAQGKVCYLVSGSGYAGGERVAAGMYRNGTPVDVEAAVWTDSQGELHAASKATPVDLVQP